MKVEKVRALVATDFGTLGTLEKAANTLPGKPSWELRVGFILIGESSTPYGAYLRAKETIWQDGLFHEDLLKIRS